MKKNEAKNSSAAFSEKKRRRENIIKKINGSGNSKCSQLSTQL
jgi:hypothetical protein